MKRLSSKASLRFGFLAAMAVGAVACVGTHGESGGTLSASKSGGSCSSAASIEAPLSRLNAPRFEEVIRELFGDGLDFQAKPFPRALDAAGYTTFASSNPTDLNASKEIMEATESIAMQVVDRVPGCDDIESSCAADYLRSVANRAFRRPATDEELNLLVGVFTSSREVANYEESVGMAVAALLQMPQFLHLLEEQAAAGEAVLKDSAIAQRMAMQLWNSLPDEELEQRAASGDLRDPEVRRQQARRMLADPRAEKALENFLEQWLQIDNISTTAFSTTVLTALREEFRRNLRAALASADGFGQLMSSRRSEVNSVLEEFYGLPSKSKGPNDWVEVEFDSKRRVGILSHPLVMAHLAHGERPSAVLRGHFVSTVLLCNTIAPPPPGATEQQATLTPPGASEREKAEARLQHPVCGSCHRLMDPIGFGFDAFDGLGGFRSSLEDSLLVVQTPASLAGDYQGVREFADTLAASASARSCFSKQYISYALGSEPTANDRCVVDELTQALGAQSIGLKNMVIEYIASPHFIQRRVGT